MYQTKSCHSLLQRDRTCRGLSATSTDLQLSHLFIPLDNPYQVKLSKAYHHYRHKLHCDLDICLRNHTVVAQVKLGLALPCSFPRKIHHFDVAYVSVQSQYIPQPQCYLHTCASHRLFKMHFLIQQQTRIVTTVYSCSMVDGERPKLCVILRNVIFNSLTILTLNSAQKHKPQPIFACLWWCFFYFSLLFCLCSNFWGFYCSRYNQN